MNVTLRYVMGKAGNCIKMLQILNTGRLFKISELADLLDTNPRNIIEYKKELDEISVNSGFFIETVPGRYGGYRLNGNAILPALKLTPREQNSFLEGVNYLLSRNDFMSNKDFVNSVSKITSRINFSENEKTMDLLVINRFPLAMDEKEIEHRYIVLKTAISQKNKVSLIYTSQKNIEKKHLFDPYELFMYNNAWFVIGWLNSKTHCDICYFKLNKIKEVQILTEKFKVWKNYKRSNYIDEYGFKNNGDWYPVEFIAYGVYANLVKERIYGKNQIVTPIDSNSTRISVEMQNVENIKSFILGFGKSIKVIKPDWLVKEIKEETLKIIQLYE